MYACWASLSVISYGMGEWDPTEGEIDEKKEKNDFVCNVANPAIYYYQICPSLSLVLPSPMLPTVLPIDCTQEADSL